MYFFNSTLTSASYRLVLENIVCLKQVGGLKKVGDPSTDKQQQPVKVPQKILSLFPKILVLPSPSSNSICGL